MIISQELLSKPIDELVKLSAIKLNIIADVNKLFFQMARSIADEIKTNNGSGKPTKLILPVGPVGQYPFLVDMCNKENISWKNVYSFNMDEYCDWQGRRLPENHPLSFKNFMKSQVFHQLRGDLCIPEDQIFFPDPMALDALSAQIDQAGGIDTCYGGIGYHGHVAFNEPPISRWGQVSIEMLRNSLTRIVPLSADTIVMNSIWNTGGNPANLPPMAVTMGMRDILSSKRIRLYCSGGSWQRTVLRIALFAEETVQYPVTLLQKHPDYEIFADKDTAQPADITLI